MTRGLAVGSKRCVTASSSVYWDWGSDVVNAIMYRDFQDADEFPAGDDKKSAYKKFWDEACETPPCVWRVKPRLWSTANDERADPKSRMPKSRTVAESE